METQTKPENLWGEIQEGAIGHPEYSVDNSSAEETERLIRVITSDPEKRLERTLSRCSFSMLKTGKTAAFAVYSKPDCVEVSEPALEELDIRDRFGEDTRCRWSRATKVDEFLDYSSPKSQELLYEWDESLGIAVPRKDVLAVVVGFPKWGAQMEGLKAKDICRPTNPLIDFFHTQNNLHPGFIGGVLTNDGINSWVMLYKNKKGAETSKSRMTDFTGGEDGISREIMMMRMGEIGIAHSEINLTPRKNSDFSKLFVKRTVRAIEAIN